MSLAELIIPSLFALAGGLVTGLLARRFQRAQAVTLESETLLKWAQEFRDASAETNTELNRTRTDLEALKAARLVDQKRIGDLEHQVKDAVDCSTDLERKLNQVQSDKLILQDRVTILESENAQLKLELDALRKRGRKGVQ